MRTALCISLLAATVSLSAAAQSWRASQGDVRVTCPLTIGGSFQAKTAALAGSLTPGASGAAHFDGTLVVDLRGLDTGISLRNDHLRDEYLEVDKAPGYDKAVLSDVALTGVSADAPEGKGAFTGTLALHGARQPVRGSVELKKAGPGVRGKASFPVTLSDYNIPDPRYLGVGVKNTVQVDVTFVVSPDATSATP